MSMNHCLSYLSEYQTRLKKSSAMWGFFALRVKVGSGFFLILPTLPYLRSTLTSCDISIVASIPGELAHCSLTGIDMNCGVYLHT